MTSYGMRVGSALWLALLACGCGGDDDPASSGNADRGDFSSAWDEPATEAQATLAEALQGSEVFEDITEALNGVLKLPRDLPVVHAACEEENAFYDPSSGQIIMCYELLEAIAQLAAQNSENEDEFGERLVGTWVFVYFHELGHGLIDVYDLPVTGREEDAVDDFSSVMLIEAELEPLAIAAAEYWALSSSGMVDALDYADEHSLNEQRFFNIICNVFGSDPERFEALVGEVLPEARARRCPTEYQQKADSWGKLLEPWAK